MPLGSLFCLFLSGRLRQVLLYNTDYRLMQVKSIASAILSTVIKLSYAIRVFVLSIFEFVA